jgi:hypothetical protein
MGGATTRIEWEPAASVASLSAGGQASCFGSVRAESICAQARRETVGRGAGAHCKRQKFATWKFHRAHSVKRERYPNGGSCMAHIILSNLGKCSNDPTNVCICDEFSPWGEANELTTRAKRRE